MVGSLLKILNHKKIEAVLHFGRDFILPGSKRDASNFLSYALDLDREEIIWVVDQYRVSTDARSGIVNDPNRENDPEYIVRLVKELAGLSIDQV